MAREELRFLKKLNSPEKIQDYLDTLSYNYSNPYMCKSPGRLLRLPENERTAHCLEGSLLAAAAQRLNEQTPFLLELVALNDDFHFIAPFQRNGLFGAMSYSRTYALKWRDPIFKSVRELALSYFPVFVRNGNLSLRMYSNPVDISCFDYMDWMNTDNCLEELGNKFDDFLHFNLFDESIQIRQVDDELEHLLIKEKPPIDFGK